MQKNNAKTTHNKMHKTKPCCNTLGGTFGPPWPICLQYLSREKDFLTRLITYICEFLYREQAILAGN